jgi:hypothetical protein
VAVSLIAWFGTVSTVYVSTNGVTGGETGFYSMLEVFVMARGCYGVVNGHRECFNWVMSM